MTQRLAKHSRYADAVREHLISRGIRPDIASLLTYSKDQPNNQEPLPPFPLVIAGTVFCTTCKSTLAAVPCHLCRINMRRYTYTNPTINNCVLTPSIGDSK